MVLTKWADDVKTTVRFHVIIASCLAAVDEPKRHIILALLCLKLTVNSCANLYFLTIFVGLEFHLGSVGFYKDGHPPDFEWRAVSDILAYGSLPIHYITIFRMLHRNINIAHLVIDADVHSRGYCQFRTISVSNRFAKRNIAVYVDEEFEVHDVIEPDGCWQHKEPTTILLNRRKSDLRVVIPDVCVGCLNSEQ